MKNTRVFIPIAILIIFIGLIFTLTVFRSLLTVKDEAPTTNDGQTAQADDINISDSKIYFKGVLTTLPEVPQRTVVNPKDNNGISVYWVRGTVDEGNDTCTLYDSGTGQIYASRYKTNGQQSGRPEGTMYYINTKLNQKKSIELLNYACFEG